jgi:hypothetical protein
MWRFLFVSFLIAHGLVHLAIWLTPKREGAAAPFDVNRSWLLGEVKPLAAFLAIAAAVLLVGGGVGLWAQAEWWRGVAVAGLGVSFGLMVLTSNPWYLFIEAVNAGLVASLVWWAWPSKAMVGV